MSLNLLGGSNSEKLKIDWFLCTSFKKSSGYIACLFQKSSGSREPVEPLLTPALFLQCDSLQKTFIYSSAFLPTIYSYLKLGANGYPRSKKAHEPKRQEL